MFDWLFKWFKKKRRFGANQNVFSDDPAGPAPNAFVPTQSDTTADPNGPFLWMFVGGAGNVKLVTAGGQTVTFNSVAAGTVLWVQHTRVWSSTTTATNMVSLR